MSHKKSILVVEDDAVMRETLAGHLGERFKVVASGSRAEAEEAFRLRRFDLVILDLHLPDGNGLSLVEKFRRDDEAAVVVITAFPKVQSAVRALKAGARDFINKPFELDEFDIVVDRALDHRGLRDEVRTFRRQRAEVRGADKILGVSAAIEALRLEIRQVAATPDTTVLIRGESGTGKELVAEAVHRESARSNAPLVRMNCSSIPASMIETELFGHERGAFTDAKAVRRGLIEIAHRGTMFLDEIGDLPPNLQPKLLRVLESKSIRRVGGNREIYSDVRFVAATNRDLEKMVRTGEFREDLLFRLNVFEIRVPSIRERREDIPLLARFFLGELSQRMGKRVHAFAKPALEALERYDWPGNVRELRNNVERALILASGDEITLGDLPTPTQTGESPTSGRSRGFLWQLDAPAESQPLLEEVQQRYILHIYELTKRNKSRAAEILGISRVTLREKLRSYGES